MRSRIMPQMQDVEAILELAATKIVSRAAERLGISQPSLSLAIQRVEKRLGCSLFARTKSGVTLTPAGREFAAQAQVLVKNWYLLEKKTRDAFGEPAGRYTLGCHSTVAAHMLPNALAQVYRQFPKVEFNLIHGLSRVVHEQIVSGDIDLGIVVNSIRNPALVLKELTQDIVTIWAPKGVRELNTLISVPELKQTNELMVKIQAQGVEYKRILTSESLEMCALLACTGLGDAILPARVAQRCQPQLTQRHPNLEGIKDTISLVCRRDFLMSPGAKTIKRALESAILSALKSEV